MAAAAELTHPSLPGYPRFRTFTIDDSGMIHLVCLEGRLTSAGQQHTTL